MSKVSSLNAADPIWNEVRQLWDSGGISKSDIGDKELKEFLKKIAGQSLYFFTKGVLGYKDLTKRTHKPIADKIQDMSIRKLLTILPRGCFKTTIGTIAFPLWVLLTKDPNFTWLIVNQAAENAERFLLEIELHIDGSNELVNWLWPRAIKPGDRFGPWSSKKMKFPMSTVLSSTPSIQAIGVGGSPESKHVGGIIKDDLIGREAMFSEAIMEEAISWDDYSVSLLKEPEKGLERMYGTRWGNRDLYYYKMKDPEYEVQYYDSINPDGTAFFPERISLDFLRKLREHNYLLYASQYRNNPSDKSVVDFNVDWLNYFLLKEINGEPVAVMNGKQYRIKDMDIVITMDTAASGDIDKNIVKMVRRSNTTRSNNAITTVGIHPSGYVFLLDLWWGRAVGENPELQIAEAFLKMAQKWYNYARRGYVEAYGAHGAIITIYNMLCKKMDFYFRLDPVRGTGRKSKVVRIRTLVGGYANEKLICVRPGHDKFVEEFADFPTGQNDTLDAFAYAIQQIRKMIPEERAEVVKAEYKKRKHARLALVGRGGY